MQCTAAYPKSNCSIDGDGCWYVSGCAVGYAKSCSSGQTLTDKDNNGCGTCKTSSSSSGGFTSSGGGTTKGCCAQGFKYDCGTSCTNVKPTSSFQTCVAC